MKRTIILATVSLTLAAILGACNSDPGDMEDGGGEPSAGGTSSGGSSTSSGGKTATGGKGTTGGNANVGGGPSSGGSNSGGAGVGGQNLAGGGMGGFGGEMGGAPSVESSCDASCAVKTAVGCEGFDDMADCTQDCVDQVSSCESEYISYRNCEGAADSSEYECFEPYPGVIFGVSPVDSYLCGAESEAYFDCAF